MFAVGSVDVDPELVGGESVGGSDDRAEGGESCDCNSCSHDSDDQVLLFLLGELGSGLVGHGSVLS